MSKLSAYWKLYPGDLLRDTMHLNPAMFGAYILLMLAYRAQRGPLLDNDKVLMTIARCTPGEWQATRDILAPLFQIHDGHWHHKRLEADLLKDTAEWEAKSNAGKHAQAQQAAKRQTQQAAQPSQSESESESESKSKPEPKPLLISVKD